MNLKAGSCELLEYRLEDQIGPLLRRAYQQACANLSRSLDRNDLTPIQYSTLVTLWEHGPTSQNRLGRLLEIKSGNMHGVARRLIQRGLVEGGSDPGHRRAVLLKLTTAGLQLVEAAIPLSEQATARTLSPLNDAEQAQLFSLLYRLIDE